MNNFIDELNSSVIFSELNEFHLKRYLNIEDDFTEDDDMLLMYLVAAKEYVINYTSLPVEKLNDIQSINIATLLLAGDFYSRRNAAFGYDNNKVNFILKSILDMHRKWL